MRHKTYVVEMGRGLYPTLQKISKPKLVLKVANIALAPAHLML